MAHFTEAVLIIGDLAVPDDPGYGFDNYGPGKALNLDYLSREFTPPLMIYFPVATSSQEMGARRGSAILTATHGNGGHPRRAAAVAAMEGLRWRRINRVTHMASRVKICAISFWSGFSL